MWRTMPGQAFRLRQFNHPDGIQFVLYNDLSGATHLLGEAAVHLLQVLRCGPADDSSLSAALATALGCAHDAALVDDTAALLSQLAGLFLIERAA
ncbi:HPr-rel-A system PqqD family peptide chaperone [Massilia sp. PAMC28688]|uniref:HPr-rel-A system PqqD family peptide chaperone n=1 Tax=Massilia sp. PAMC28688 TaxID=2861283 RepID=UPI001C625608|nr:HPr-rel-A system PqqD family peptide chaperone [Massilia sp. PAMC28688]QYF95051.1 HPr-rel-A system PqqD family peptide chaperone [Massilia sp. PAMC28688]